MLTNKEQIQNEINYVPSKYTRNLSNYTKCEYPTVLPFISAICKRSHYGSKYPVHKLLKAIAKILMLNEIESVFLAYIVKQTRWDISDRLISENADSVRDILCVAIDQTQYKCLILYLMLCSYTVKFYLNEDADESMEEAQRVCPSFKTIFSSWAKKYNSLTSKISPRTLNRVYKQIYSQSRYQQPDFDLMVDAIIQISPAYNPDKHRQDQVKKPVICTTSPLKTHKTATLLSYTNDKTTQSSSFFSNSRPQCMNIPLFSSSGFMHLINANLNMNLGTVNQIQSGNPDTQFNTHDNVQNSLVNQFNTRERPHRNSFNSAFNSSVGGFPLNFSMKDDEEECAELMIGLEDGHSEQNIYFDNGNVTEANPSTNKTGNTSKGAQESGFVSVITLNKPGKSLFLSRSQELFFKHNE